MDFTDFEYTHMVEYYINDKMVKLDNLADVNEPALYWNEIKKLASACTYGYVSIGEYAIVHKCARNFDYAISRLIKIPTI